MSLEDEVNARRKIARDGADRSAFEEGQAEAARVAGREELRRLIIEGYLMLRKPGARRAVGISVSRHTHLFRADTFTAACVEYGYAVAGGRYVFTDRGTLVKQAGGAVYKLSTYGWPADKVSAARQAAQALFPNAVFTNPGEEISWELKRPSGWDDQFFVENGQLVFGDGESYQPPTAQRTIAEWVAEAIER